MANGLAGLLGAIGSGVDAIGGGVPSVYGGLLSEEELRAAKSRAQQDALAKMASAFYAAGAPRSTPGGGTGQAIAQALQAGREGYQGALSGQLQEKMAQQKIQQALAAQKRTANVNQLIQGAFQQAQPAQKATMIGGAPYGMDTPAQPAKFDLQAIAPQLMATAEGRQALQSLQGMMKPESFTLAEGAVQYERDPLTGQVRQVAAGAPKTTKPVLSDYLAKAVDVLGFERKNANQYTPQERAQINAKAQELAKQAGTTYTYTGEMPAGKKGVEDAQQALLTSGQRQMAYNQIQAGYRPEYSTAMFRGEQEWNALKEKFGAGTLDPQQQATLTDYSQWKQNSITNINERIKELTGAAMGVQEAQRIISSLPNPGTGVFDGDSPTQFKAKLDNAMAQLRLVEARNAYIVRTGSASFSGVSLEKMPQIINDKAKEIATQYKLDPNNPRDKQMIMKQLSAFFGISLQ